MAYTLVPVESVGVLQVQTGVDGEGNPIIKSRRFYNIKHDATHDNVYACLAAIKSLDETILETILRQDNGRVEEDI